MDVFVLIDKDKQESVYWKIAEKKLSELCRNSKLIYILTGTSQEKNTAKTRLISQLDAMDKINASENEYALLWDASYIPCCVPRLFGDDGLPIMDFCSELTLYEGVSGKLIPEIQKGIVKSFRTGHLLIKTEFLRAMIQEIESIGKEKGYFRERILSMNDPKIGDWGTFDLYEMYGTYVLCKKPRAYGYREWRTFRQGADLLEATDVTDNLLSWLAKDFDAVSFENGHQVREDNRGIFVNPAYQSRLMPAQLVQAIQGEYRDDIGGRIDGILTAIELMGLYKNWNRGKEWCVYERIGDDKKNNNPKQAWLSWQHAAFLCDSVEEKKRIQGKMENLGVFVPPVSFVIVSYNARVMMQECIESIRRHAGSEEYHIIVVDNASTDGVREYLQNQEDIRLKLNEDNVGFPVGCNQGIEIAPIEDDIFFLNNDTRMTHNALYWLRMGLYETQDTGATGAVSNYAGVGQMLELLLASAENYEAYGRIKNVPMKDAYDEAKILCGFAMLVRRQCIEQYGGMDEMFSPGYYEDTDMSLRLRKNGYRLRICKNSFVYHAGGMNFKKRADLDEINDRNLLYLAKKWGTEFMDL